MRVWETYESYGPIKVLNEWYVRSNGLAILRF